ncbi:MAG: hypothetical protein GW748_02405 [Alphaproteobacteria bacterium]|nr:hypothetical protein [Alphaproteobacteria bacterium]NCQ66579.1 hypothetical protein [Alphaproteobacteria bacterium]NCT06931.1 hypothetical protein [Alphaproteobacteria bacterium]
MKKIVKLISFAFLLAFTGVQEASAGLTETAMGYAEKAKGYFNAAKAYQASKNYDDIADSKAKTAIKLLCQKGCGRFTCGKSGTKKKVGEACKLMCPPNDVKNCVNKM